MASQQLNYRNIHQQSSSAAAASSSSSSGSTRRGKKTTTTTRETASGTIAAAAAAMALLCLFTSSTARAFRPTALTRQQQHSRRPAFLVVGRGISSVSDRCLGRSTATGLLQQQRQQQPLRLSVQKSRLFSTTSSSTTTDSDQNLAAATSSTAAKQSYDVLNRQGGLESYDPASFESEIYQWWEKSGCFLPDAKQHSHHAGSNSKIRNDKSAKRESYVLPMPPPNVTGRLHMGHAIFVALQDVLARFHRMRGKAVLWLPGTDHAGIATQLQVEKQLLAQEQKTRQDVGRDEFLRRVWDYKAEQGGHITRQLRSLGASADWSRERFTMDADLSEAVVEAFVRLHEKGLVYRGEYMVNWAPMLQTAVSDLEVEYSDEQGKLYYFKYMIEGSKGMCYTKSV
jgi:hypothetical protein